MPTPANLVSALGPGSKLRSLAAFAPDYKRVRTAFSDLLVFPNLEAISLSEKGSSLADNLRDTVVSGDARFTSLCTIDVGLTQKVVSWNSTLGAVIGELDVATFVATMAPVAKSYADHARAQAEDNQKFFSELADYIDLLDKRIDDMSKKLTTLDGDIKTQNKALEDSNILTTLYNIFKDIYKLATSMEGADVQIATLLNLDVSSLKGSFSALFTDRSRLNRIIASLSHLRAQITDLRVKFTALRNGLKNVVVSSAALLDVWDDVATRLEAVATITTRPSASDIAAIKKAWGTVAADAQAYADAITSRATVSANQSFQSFLEQREAFGASPIIPQSPEELRLFRLADAAGVKPGGVKALRPFDELVQANADLDEKAVKIVKAVLGPPEDAIARLDALADDSGKVIDEFNELLKQPYLDQLACTDPVNGSQTNINMMVIHFKEEYIKLQQKTVDVARKLSVYADMQVTLLPLVVTKEADKNAGELTLKEFIDTNAPLVKEYLGMATELSNLSLKMKNDWDNAIAVVKKAINECTSHIETWQKSVDQMTAEQKKATLWSVLSGIGALVAFTAAAFLPGIGMLAALAIGGVLGVLSVQQAIEAHKLGTAINELKAQIANASATRSKLQVLLPYMEGIAASLSQISGIWSDIATALTKLDAFYTVLGGVTGAILLNTLRPQVITNWRAVSAAVQKYINVIAH